MKAMLVVIAACSLLAVGIVSTQMQDATAQDQHTVHVEAYTLTYDDAPDGSECMPWGIVDDTLEVEPFRQLVVTDHSGVVVGVLDLQIGKYRTGDNGQQSCVFASDMRIDDAPFYTFTVDGKYRRTVSRESLTDMDWEIFAHLL